MNVTDEQKPKWIPWSATAKKLAAAKDMAAVAGAKADFTKQVLAVLDDAQLAQYKALTNPAPAGRSGHGGAGGGGRARIDSLSTADAYPNLYDL